MSETRPDQVREVALPVRFSLKTAALDAELLPCFSSSVGLDLDGPALLIIRLIYDDVSPQPHPVFEPQLLDRHFLQFTTCLLPFSVCASTSPELRIIRPPTCKAGHRILRNWPTSSELDRPDCVDLSSQSTNVTLAHSSDIVGFDHSSLLPADQQDNQAETSSVAPLPVSIDSLSLPPAFPPDLTFPTPLSAVEDQLTWWYRTIAEDLNVDVELIAKVRQSPGVFYTGSLNLPPGAAPDAPRSMEEQTFAKKTRKNADIVDPGSGDHIQNADRIHGDVQSERVQDIGHDMEEEPSADRILDAAATVTLSSNPNTSSSVAEDCNQEGQSAIIPMNWRRRVMSRDAFLVEISGTFSHQRQGRFWCTAPGCGAKSYPREESVAAHYM
ncbi:hypothetical protein EVG20_g11569, partial [Dentipellis fragilis]